MQENNSARFVAIASLYSELVAINTHGQLCQWKWANPDPYINMEVSIADFQGEEII